MTAADVVASIRRDRLVAILRSSRPELLPEAADVLVANGVGTLELPLTGPHVLDAIEAAVQVVGDRGHVGAGTVRTVDDARRAIDAGAAFLVAPGLSVPVLELAATRGVAALPGVVTPTEIETALQAGAELVKLFPAGSLGPDYLRLIRTPYPDLAAVPTGGVGREHAAAWLDAGAVALGVGTPLTGTSLEDGDLEALARSARDWKAAVA